MAKTIYTSGTIDALIQRVSRLSKDQEPYWGSMNATEMLHHCNLANDAILNAPKATLRPTLKQRMKKLAFFHIKKDFPKGARGAKKFNTKGLVDSGDFEKEKENFIKILSKFKTLEHELGGIHPVFGSLDHYYWGRFVWKHMDHHMKQFGV
ncbi:DUF1569 domain-containing protein [Belliella sp. DSM 111904]|uniref:DUF1569 domain-containing protein n=1 Tax=Belliella filtrata TaxID=2923435 RepID=A0ABS9UZK4_9BACT|nr:DUF1569 domain-containing protein [Belliella filtrata]MCH7409578.1 DUF1569 domain-containing protein [Belliella filtrata]